MLIGVLIAKHSDAVPLSDFISFGRSNGDLKLSKTHRAASSAIFIPRGFFFFNEQQTKVYVSYMFD